MGIKMFRAALTVEFPYNEVESPMALGSQIEAALASGKAQIADNIVPASGGKAVVTMSTNIVNVRAPKEPVRLHAVEEVEDDTVAAAE